jgi:hypothetical protein
MKFVRSASLALLLALATRGQEPTTTLPHNYQNIFENQSVAVIHVHYAPHEKVPVHDHSKFPTVYVYLSDSGPVLFSHVEDHLFSITRKPLKMGAYRISPGRIERHTVENKGDIASDFLRVELKQIPLGHQNDEHRGGAPDNLDHNLDVVKFTSTDLQVERIICAAASSCAVKAANSPSLLIAFTPANLGPVDQMKADTVRWMPSGESLSVKMVSATHLLRILLPQSPDAR